MLPLKPNFIYDFTSDSQKDWQIVDDRVMGGVSQGDYAINQEGNGIFSGHVSIENNGGFSSLRHSFKPANVEAFNKIVLRVKGDTNSDLKQITQITILTYSLLKLMEIGKKLKFPLKTSFLLLEAEH